MSTEFYYGIYSYDKGKGRVYQSFYGLSREEFEEWLQGFKETLPHYNTEFHKGWIIEGERHEFLNNLNKADKLYKKLLRGEIAPEELPGSLQ